jgi:hypothetical protein
VFEERAFIITMWTYEWSLEVQLCSASLAESAAEALHQGKALLLHRYSHMLL